MSTVNFPVSAQAAQAQAAEHSHGSGGSSGDVNAQLAQIVTLLEQIAQLLESIQNGGSNTPATPAAGTPSSGTPANGTPAANGAAGQSDPNQILAQLQSFMNELQNSGSETKKEKKMVAKIEKDLTDLSQLLQGNTNNPAPNAPVTTSAS
jgi:hypothetical protein